LAQAQDAEALRRELEQLRRQQEQYQKTIDALSERLKRLEQQTAPPAPPPPPPGDAAPAPVVLAPGSPPTSTSSPSGHDLLSPRQPFSLYQQRGSGQLLFDIGVAGDFVGNLPHRNGQ